MSFAARARLALALALLAGHVMLPVTQAQTIAEACVDALASDGPRWDGPSMDTFTWDGTPIDPGAVDTTEVTVCRANGPLEILPPAQFIGCILVDGRLASINGLIGCGAYREIRVDSDSAILWIAQSSATSNEVSRLIWNGSMLERERTYTACWDDPVTPISDPVDCGR